MKTMMTYPSTDIAESIYTDFVNGVKFDICEVQPIAHDMLFNSRNRFFLAIEDDFIYKYASAESFFAETGKTRWDIFCMTKQECKDLISEYENYYNRLVKLAPKAANPAFKFSAKVKYDSIINHTIKLFGKAPL